MNASQQTRILIVDDKPANRKALKVLLSQLEVTVIEAEDGNEALTLVATQRLALLLLDVDMPGMDGYEVARMIRSVDETKNLPIIFVTAAFSDELHRILAYQAGGIDYIEKPIDDRVLLAKVKVFLELFDKTRETERLNNALQEQLNVKRAIEKELRENQIKLNDLAEQYRDLYDNAPDMYTSVDAETAQIKQCNRTLAIKLGYGRDEIIGRPIFDLYHPDCMADVQKAFQTFLSTGLVVNAEQTLKKKNGQGIPVILNVSAVRDETGKILHSRSSWRDISDRKAVELKLQQSEKRFRELVGNLPGIIYRCRMDSDWTMLHISDTVETISGYPASDFINNRVRSFASIIHPDDVQLVEEKVSKGVKNREPFEIEYRIVDHKGEIHWVYEKGQGANFSDGHPQYLDGAIFDITTHKQAERERMLFQRAVEQSPVSVVITDLDGIIQYVNPTFCKVTGYDQEEVIGQNPRVLKSGHTSEEEYQQLWDIIISGGVWHGEFQNRRKDGSTYWELASISPVRAQPDGPITHFIGVKEEITKRKEAEETLRRAQWRAEEASRAKSEFLSTMSHEIRTPMNAIIGMSDQLAEMSLDSESQRYLEIIRRNGNNLLILINDILDLSKIEAGHLSLDLAPFDLCHFFENVTAGFQPQAKKKNLQLKWHMDPDMRCYRIGDVHRLRQIVENIIGNALKFTHEGEIRIAIHQDRESVERIHFEVTDSGIGIPPEQQKIIFEAFSQADGSTTRNYGGTGLGLSICKRLVEQMKGEISVNSTPGRGSTFSFSLPLACTSRQTVHTEHSRWQPHRQTQESSTPASLNILLAEDVEDNIFLIQSYCNETRHRLKVVKDGKQAVEEAMTGSYDIILMDIQMPVMDGYEATRKVRAWERANNRTPLPILALTAHALEGEEEKSFQAGCNDHLTKPIRKQALIDILKSYHPQRETNTDPAPAPSPIPASSTPGDEPMDAMHPATSTDGDMALIITPNKWNALKADMGNNINRLVKTFLERLPDRQSAIREAINNADGHALEEMCHKLKGGAATMGADYLSLIARQMEQAAKAGELHLVTRQLGDFDTECQRVARALGELLGGG